MRNQVLLATCLLAAATAGASCGPVTGDELQPAGPPGAPPSTLQVGNGEIPCDLAEELKKACWGCHSGENTLGDTALDSYEALVGPSVSNPDLTVAELSVAMMKDPAAPMPPSGKADPADIALLEAWIADGYPKGECGTGGTQSQGETQIICTSGAFWAEQDDEGSKDMNPGRACIDCHQTEDEGPSLLVAGTVYPTLHEPDDCNGLPGGVTVVVTDATQAQYTATVRASGNFFLEADEEKALVFPITAEVRRGDQVLPMKDPVDSADCNTCHSVLGAEGAAGRIVAP